ncbi:MAG: NADH-quinone oxidoreductase subunit NuoF [Thermoanaerobaculia bacterium]
MMEPILTKFVSDPESYTLKGYLKNWGFEGLKKALKMKPEDIIEEVKASGLRGRGGAGFPTGLKWSFVPKDFPGPKYIVINADEGEPGTFKDKVIIEKEPFMLLEGIAIAALAIGAEDAFIYIRGEFVEGARVLGNAIKEAEEEGYLGKNYLNSGKNLYVRITRGAGAYICGEETGLIESLEGKRGHPRLRPPFPATKGFLGKPTVVNNVETLSCLPHIISKGAQWFSSIGSNPKNSGTKLFPVSGDVKKPGVYEAPLGIPLKQLIEDYAGGFDGKPRAIIPGGVSAPVLDERDFEIPMDFDSLLNAKSMLGSGAIIVLNEKRCLFRSALRIVSFFAEESCGQCSPCREGTRWLELIMERIREGEGREGDLELMKDIASGMIGTTICVLSDGCAMSLLSFIEKFEEEFKMHIGEGKCQNW